MTIVLTVALTVGLSVAPLPDDWRPLLELRERPARTLAAVFVPKLVSGSSVRASDAVTGAPELALAASQPVAAAEPAAATDAPASTGVPSVMPTPAATLGATEARNVRALEELAGRIGARHVEIMEGCRKPDGQGGCAQRALDPLFTDLETLDRGRRRKPVRVVHLGDSLIASDHITDLIRSRLELRHGSGGRGFLFVDRPTKLSGRKVRTGEASEGWEVYKLTDKEERGVLGFSGVRFASAGVASETTQFELRDSRVADLFFLTQPSGGLLEVKADDKPVGKILTSYNKPEVAFARLNVPEGARRLAVRTRSGPVSLFGAALENGQPGIVYDSIGIPGGTAEVFLRAEERSFASQLAHRSPSLVVVMLGGNEAYEMGRGWMDMEKARRTSDRLLERVRAAVPKAACLVFGPMDAGVRSVDGRITPRKYTAEVGETLREVAMARGCAYWDTLTAMGGLGSAERWFAEGLIHEDLAHPRASGSDLVGHLFDFALERARLSRPGAWSLPPDDPPGLEVPGNALARTFGRLQGLEAGAAAAGAVSIVQLGASHTASHMFTDEVRERLARVFGGAGRGFVAAGKASPRLSRAKVSRRLEGAWNVPDAREREPGEAWGLTGARAEGGPGAIATFTFGVDERAGDEPGTLGLYLLEKPGMGVMEIRIDGERVGAHPAAEPQTQAARVLSWPVKGRSHTIEIENKGGGPITLFGAALDLEVPGVRYDALGLPGSTCIMADGYDKPVWVEQLRARRPDLYVLFYGTNEAAIANLEPERLERHYVSLLGTLRQAAPESECLVMGPTDRLRREGKGWVEAPAIDMVIATLRKVARENGCAFWSARAAMGGPRSIARWQQLEPALGHPDGVHLTRLGYEMLAAAFADELLGAYRGWAQAGSKPPERAEAPSADPLDAPPQPAASVQEEEPLEEAERAEVLEPIVLPEDRRPVGSFEAAVDSSAADAGAAPAGPDAGGGR